MTKQERYDLLAYTVEKIAFMDIAPTTGGNTHLVHYYKDKALDMQRIAMQALEALRNGS